MNDFDEGPGPLFCAAWVAFVVIMIVILVLVAS